MSCERGRGKDLCSVSGFVGRFTVEKPLQSVQEKAGQMIQMVAEFQDLPEHGMIDPEIQKTVVFSVRGQRGAGIGKMERNRNHTDICAVTDIRFDSVCR